MKDYISNDFEIRKDTLRPGVDKLSVTSYNKLDLSFVIDREYEKTIIFKITDGNKTVYFTFDSIINMYKSIEGLFNIEDDREYGNDKYITTYRPFTIKGFSDEFSVGYGDGYYFFEFYNIHDGKLQYKNKSRHNFLMLLDRLESFIDWIARTSADLICSVCGSYIVGEVHITNSKGEHICDDCYDVKYIDKNGNTIIIEDDISK